MLWVLNLLIPYLVAFYLPLSSTIFGQETLVQVVFTLLLCWTLQESLLNHFGPLGILVDYLIPVIAALVIFSGRCSVPETLISIILTAAHWSEPLLWIAECIAILYIIKWWSDGVIGRIENDEEYAGMTIETIYLWMSVVLYLISFVMVLLYCIQGSANYWVLAGLVLILPIAHWLMYDSVSGNIIDASLVTLTVSILLYTSTGNNSDIVKNEHLYEQIYKYRDEFSNCSWSRLSWKIVTNTGDITKLNIQLWYNVLSLSLCISLVLRFTFIQLLQHTHHDDTGQTHTTSQMMLTLINVTCTLIFLHTMNIITSQQNVHSLSNDWQALILPTLYIYHVFIQDHDEVEE